ncbi:MAG: RidA family protein [Phycisphaerae bacterium]|nr:RidA family protein [Gemmatimonadaceae bacterium]
MMQRQFIVSAPGLAQPPSPISQAVVAGNQCWVSGQLSVAEDGTFIPGSATEESARAFGNVFAALTAAGFSAGDIVFIDIAFIDLADVRQVNDVMAALFTAGRLPARTIHQAAALPYGGRVKVQAVAVRDVE